mmetsp:Transcript_5555/g.15077  ORF Transcript_5555/g.15077 Transcript_5555/m.15077 type:complete len:262 (-) Transcript_5555:87-872(-)
MPRGFRRGQIDRSTDSVGWPSWKTLAVSNLSDEGVDMQPVNGDGAGKVHALHLCLDSPCATDAGLHEDAPPGVQERSEQALCLSSRALFHHRHNGLVVGNGYCQQVLVVFHIVERCCGARELQRHPVLAGLALALLNRLLPTIPEVQAVASEQAETFFPTPSLSRSCFPRCTATSAQHAHCGRQSNDVFSSRASPHRCCKRKRYYDCQRNSCQSQSRHCAPHAIIFIGQACRSQRLQTAARSCAARLRDHPPHLYFLATSA